MSTVVDVKGLSVTFPTDEGVVRAVNDVSFSVREGESVGIVGESGSGKSTVAFALFDSVPSPGQISEGEVRFENGKNLLDMSEEERRRFYWSRISMVFQAAQNTLNPILRIQRQVEDIADAHNVSKKDAIARASELFETMYLHPKRVLSSYPHELSGGMKQRVSIALALLLNPRLVVLDEPTTALDVISQASVLRILDEVRRNTSVSFLFITHDISVISQVVDRVLVMYAGRVVESGPVRKIVTAPTHPYTRGLVASIPPLVGDLSGTKSVMGQPANLMNLPKGCAFYDRCEIRQPRCALEPPAYLPIDDDSAVACHVATGQDQGVNGP